MRNICIFAALICASTVIALAVDVHVGSWSDLTWTGSGTTRTGQFTTVATTTTTTQPDVTDGLISKWPFDGDANDTVSTNHGVVSGAVLTNGVKGVADTAYSFDLAADDLITIGTQSVFYDMPTLSVSFWCLMTTVGGNDAVMISKASNATWTDYGFSVLNYATGGPYVRFVTKTGTNPTGIGILNAHSVTGSWHHVAATYDGTNMCLYLNGLLVAGPTAQSGNITSNTMPLRIGADQSGRNWSGGIDEVRIYNRAISSNEQFTIYNLEKP